MFAIEANSLSVRMVTPLASAFRSLALALALSALRRYLTFFVRLSASVPPNWWACKWLMMMPVGWYLFYVCF